MKQGVALKIKTDYDYAEELNVLCSFAFDGQNYILAVDEEDDYICRKIKWNPWKGTYTVTEPVSKKVFQIANILLKKAEINKELYSFKAEHYIINDCRERIFIKKQKRLRILNKYIGCIPFILRLLTELIFTLACAFFCVHTSEITIAANVFTEVSRKDLVAVIYLIQLAGALLLFFIRRSDRALPDLYINAVIPYSTIALIAAFRISAAVRIITILAITMLLLIFVMPKVVQAVRAKKASLKKKYWKSAFRRCFLPFAVCICVSSAVIFLFGLPVYTYSSNKSDTVDVQSLDAFNEIRQGLRTEKWEKFSTQEKLDILQVICVYECKNTLGCEPPKVVAGRPERDTIYGSYSENNKTVTISLEHLENDAAEEVLKTLLHEARHVYQHAAIDAFNSVEDKLSEKEKALSCFKTIESYRDNFEHYNSGKNNFYKYYDQYVEYDSRTWAEWRVQSEYYVFLYPVTVEDEPVPAETAADLK